MVWCEDVACPGMGVQSGLDHLSEDFNDFFLSVGWLWLSLGLACLVTEAHASRLVYSP